MGMTDTQIKEILLEMGVSTDGINGANAPVPGAFSAHTVREDGVYETISQAVSAVSESQAQFSRLPVRKRAEVIEAMRRAAVDNAELLAKLAHEETGYGVVAHKIAKNRVAAEKTPGLEDFIPTAYSGDNGLTLIEHAPYGVIGSITPSTNPTATIINNSLSMIAGANGVVFNPHPGAKNASNEAVKILNRAIRETCGVSSLLGTVVQPSAATGKELMEHAQIRMLAITGGEAVVNLAMRSGKKVIAAGPGNPPVIVDETADIEKAAKDITRGASFDNNVMCIAEKEVFVVSSVESRLVENMVAAGCYLADEREVEIIARTVIAETKHGLAANKNFVGRSATHILKSCGINYSGEPVLIICRCKAEHPLVTTEMLMPVLPIVSVGSFEEAVKRAVAAENGYLHTAIMHSKNIDNLTIAARALDTTIFVKNAPSFAGLGLEGEGHTSLTIATPTGEGVTSAKSFVRARRCALSGSFYIL
ncbi:MAG: aldehyde dehydrogenase EutE [Oscillospiraceae bacterium]|nr:aldehyde dehydrogenase EutE [Oscillospiraceae bacterium]MCL2277801.1 aldehyde dehydrogenase EutE [Oscillospiraceae bacterium]